MSNYPPGALSDPKAPWNEPEVKQVDCPACNGCGIDYYVEHGESYKRECEECDGTGMQDEEAA